MHDDDSPAILGLAPCFGCGNMFSFNPDKVPSIRVEGVRQAICQDCVNRVNPMRAQNGLEPIVPMPGAYEPQIIE